MFIHIKYNFLYYVIQHTLLLFFYIYFAYFNAFKEISDETMLEPGSFPGQLTYTDILF